MSYRMPTAKRLEGKRIVRFRSNPFRTARGDWAHSPTISLDDGSLLRFVVEETDSYEYGVFIVVTKRNARRRTRSKPPSDSRRTG